VWCCYTPLSRSLFQLRIRKSSPPMSAGFTAFDDAPELSTPLLSVAILFIIFDLGGIPVSVGVAFGKLAHRLLVRWFSSPSSPSASPMNGRKAATMRIYPAATNGKTFTDKTRSRVRLDRHYRRVHGRPGRRHALLSRVNHGTSCRQAFSCRGRRPDYWGAHRLADVDDVRSSRGPVRDMPVCDCSL